MHIFVAGIGTDVGKTVVSAVLMTLLKADYWKPIECGDEDARDSHVIRTLTNPKDHFIHPSAYSFKDSVSPHQAARLANSVINRQKITLPKISKSLIIEGVGGIFVPIDHEFLTIDLFGSWDAGWIIVSKNYLGSINHTLLTLEALKARNIPVLGLVFNGAPNPDTESVILKLSKLPALGRLLQEDSLNLETIKKYAELWKKTALPIFNSFKKI